MRILPALAATALAATTLTACSSGASYSERMTYLRKVADRGVETHNLLYNQGARIDAKRCSDAYAGLQDNNPPGDTEEGGVSDAWAGQVQQFFVDSCVTGLPKPVPGQATPTPAPSGPTPSSPTPSKPPSKSP